MIRTVNNECYELERMLERPLAQGQIQRVIELGCAGARLARQFLAQRPQISYLGLEVDAVQHQRNLEAAQVPNIEFLAAAAQDIPRPDASFDLALMLKSLHHVPLDAMQRAIQEVARVLRPGGYFYISEPVYVGALNNIVRLYNDEGLVRAAAQDAIECALAADGSPWREIERSRFDMPVHFADFDDFAQRMLYPTFAQHNITPELKEKIATAFAPYCTSEGDEGARFSRPMLVRLLQKLPKDDGE